MNNQINLNSILEYLNNQEHEDYIQDIQYVHAKPSAIVNIPKIDELSFDLSSPLLTDNIPRRQQVITINGSDNEKDTKKEKKKEEKNKDNETTVSVQESTNKQEQPTQQDVQQPTSTKAQNNAAVPDIINNVIKTAEQQLNKPFLMGSKGPNAFDCSGLCYYAYKANGINIPGSTLAMIQSDSQKVDINDVRPGDVIITKSVRRANGRHARLVTKVENGVIHVIEAKGKKWGVVRGTYKPNGNLLTIRRFVTADKLQQGGLLNNLFYNDEYFSGNYLPKILTYTHAKPEVQDVEPIIDLSSAYDPFSPFNFGEEGRVDRIVINYEDEDEDEQEATEETPNKQQSDKKEEFEKEPKPYKENQQYLGNLGDEPKKGKFANSDKGKTEFFSTMFNTYRKVLKDRGLDPDWAYILTASASIESAYGHSLGAHYNYGGVKVTKAQREKGISHQWSMTPDWFRDANGNLYKKRHLQPFRAYSSIEDYCNRVINLLSGKMYQMFQKYNPHDYVNTWYHILDSGYAKSDYKNQMHYAKILGQRVDELKRRLKL